LPRVNVASPLHPVFMHNAYRVTGKHGFNEFRDMIACKTIVI
jgi:hypothetical protein